MDDNKTLLADPASQVPEIKTFLEINQRGRVSEAQAYLLGKVNTDKPERLQAVVNKYIDLIFDAQEACKILRLPYH